jgi:hypothetical protein
MFYLLLLKKYTHFCVNEACALGIKTLNPFPPASPPLKPYLP